MLSLILFAFLVGSSSAHHIHIHTPDTSDYGNNLNTDIQNYGINQPSDVQDYGLGVYPDSYGNNYQSYSGSDLWKLLSGNYGNIYPSNYGLASTDGSNYLSGYPNIYGSTYQRPMRSSYKENFVRNYDSGAAEYGVRNEVSVKTNYPSYDPSYTRICTYFPSGTCVRGTNKYPRQAVY